MQSPCGTESSKSIHIFNIIDGLSFTYFNGWQCGKELQVTKSFIGSNLIGIPDDTPAGLMFGIVSKT